MTRKYRFCIGLIAWLVPTVLGAANQAITLAFAGKEITIIGATPGASVVLFGVANIPGDFYPTLDYREQLLTADKQGMASYTSTDAVPGRSVWFAVDARTGEIGVAAPPGFPLRPALAAPHILDDASAQSILDVPTDLAYALVVQPGTGAWIGGIAKGSAHDLNPAGRASRVRLTSFYSLDKSASHPGHLTPADVVIIVDPHSLRFYAGKPVTQ